MQINMSGSRMDVSDMTPKKTITRLLSWHAGDVKDIVT